MKPLLCLLSALFLLTTTVTGAENSSESNKTIRLDDFAKLGYKGWDYSGGGKAPGGVEIVKDGDENITRLHGDMTEKGKYSGAVKRVHLDGPYQLEKVILKIKSTAAKSATVRLVDVTGQIHQRRNFKFAADGQWHDAEIAVDKTIGGEHWGGANDGKWHDPLKEIWLNLTKKSSPDSKPEIFIKDVRAVVKVPGKVDAAPFSETFEKSTKVPGQSEGDVKIVSTGAFAGSNCLAMARTKAKALTEKTTFQSEPFKAAPGKWTLSGVGKCDLFSPDLSFSIYIYAEWLDKEKQVIRKDEISILNAKQNWKSFSRKLDAPEGTRFARFFARWNKTYGTAFIDDLKAMPPKAAKAIDLGKIYRLESRTDTLGNLFYPGKPVVLNVEVQATKPLTPKEAKLHCLITDYWGAEETQPFTVDLKLDKAETGLLKYRSELNLEQLTNGKFQQGKYYEVHFTVNQEQAPVYREKTTFAILPEPISKKYPAQDVPFTSRNWDNRVWDYILLSDRLGIRQVGVYSKWDPKPPYKPMLFAAKRLEKMGIGMVGRSPLFQVEREGFANFSEEGIRQGAKNFIQKYGYKNMLWLTLGNEPHGGLEEAKRNVKAYKAAYEAIKEIRPDFQLIGTSVGPDENYFKAGFQAYQDVYDFHTYGDYDTIPKIFAKYEALFKKYGGKKPICSTEIGLNSQGMDRQFISQDLVKKLAIFVACGGKHIGWFTICFPDRDGSRGKSSRQSFNVFYGKYAIYTPKLDAVSYYHILNSICVKKGIDQKTYPDGTRCYLFKDKDNQFLQVLWNDKEEKEISMPLKASGKIKVTRLDGRSHELVADGGITVNVSRDPIIITYANGNTKLPAELGAPLLQVKERPGSVIKGTSTELILTGKGLTTDQVKIVPPLNWKASVKQDGADKVLATLTIPRVTNAREGKVAILRENSQGIIADINLGVKLASRVAAKLMPIAVNQPGGPGVRLVITNNGDDKQNVSWEVSMNEAMPMKDGSYDLVKPVAADAYFKVTSNGEMTIDGHKQQSMDLAIDNMDPLTIYRVKAKLTDSEGKTIKTERLMGGFAGAPKAKTAVKLDGKLDESDWKRASVCKLDSQRQYMWWPKYNQPWEGPQDLSANLRYMWDDKYLYIGVEVTDDVFVNPKCDDSLWAMDGLQFLVDPARSGEIRAGKYDFSMGIGSKGPQAWYHLTADPGRAPAGEAKDIIIGHQRGKNGNITYEVAIPWHRISPFKPKLGADLGLAMVINETDAGKRGALIAWFSGVHLKEADMVGDIILTE